MISVDTSDKVSTVFSAENFVQLAQCASSFVIELAASEFERSVQC